MKRWLINRTNKEFVDYLSSITNISPVLAQILINRSLKTPDTINSYFSSDINSLEDPFKLSGMHSTVERINAAVRSGEKILIHGDYDADGTTATAILVNSIKRLGGDIHYIIPSRFNNGYGFGESAVKIAKDKNIGLIITVDCGITSFESVEIANNYGIDVIITDHHEPKRIKDCDLNIKDYKNAVSNTTTIDSYLLPNAYCIVNPKVQSSHFNEKSAEQSSTVDLSGAGIAFKLACALFSGRLDKITDLLDIAAIGTIADVVPLLGENRIIVKEGLKILHSSKRPGIRALMDVCGMGNKSIESQTLSYTVIPRINAAGRMDDANDVVKLLITESNEEAKKIALWLNNLNSERQKVEEFVLNSVINQIKHNGYKDVIIAANEGWHEGVLGIVASKIAEKYNMPAFIFSIKDGVAKGSARSISSYDICEGINFSSDYLIRFGGHKQAAGLMLKADSLSLFEQKLNEHIKNNLSDEDLMATISIDAGVELRDINFSLLSQLSLLAPFGYGNPKPLLGAKGLMSKYLQVVGKNHLKMKLGHNGYFLDAISYSQGGLISKVSSSEKIDVVFTPEINEYNGSKSIYLNVKALREGV